MCGGVSRVSLCLLPQCLRIGVITACSCCGNCLGIGRSKMGGLAGAALPRKHNRLQCQFQCVFCQSGGKSLSR